MRKGTLWASVPRNLDPPNSDSIQFLPLLLQKNDDQDHKCCDNRLDTSRRGPIKGTGLGTSPVQVDEW